MVCRAVSFAALSCSLSSGLGCNAGSELDEGKLCDPVSDVDREAELFRPVAAGRDAEGVVYVLDSLGTQLLVYRSEGEHVLRRLPVMGDGENGALFQQATVEGDPGFTLVLETDLDRTQVFSKHPEGRVDPAASDGGEELEPVDLTELDTFTVRGFSGEVVLEYHGQFLEGARRVVVLRPSHDGAYEDFRVFIGTHNRMVEREVYSVARQLDGGTTTIEIALDGARATLRFPVLDETDLESSLYTLERKGKTELILPLDHDGGSESALIYYCR